MKLIQLSNEDYHANRTHVSKSWLDKIERSPAHLKAYLDGVEEREESPALLFGSMFHTLVLEPDLFDSQYAIAPECDRRTAKGKEIWQGFLDQSAGKKAINAHDFSVAQKMLDNIQSHTLARKLLTAGKPEQSVLYKDESGVDCKARADWLRENFIVDLKTTDDASPKGFAKSIANYRYQVQAVHYQKGFDLDRFVFVAVEKKPPYAVAVYILDEDAIYNGSETRKRNIDTYAECLVKNQWPGYSEHLTPISLPGWAI